MAADIIAFPDDGIRSELMKEQRARAQQQEIADAVDAYQERAGGRGHGCS